MNRSYLAGVIVTIADGQAACHHVGVPDRLHLVHVIFPDDAVKQRVQVVEQINHLATTIDIIPNLPNIIQINCLAV